MSGHKWLSYSGDMANILLVTRFFPPLVSGGSRRPFEVYRYLSSLGHKVQVIAPHLPEDVSGSSIGPCDRSAPHHSVFSGPMRKALLGPAKLARKYTSLPDGERSWARLALKAARDLMEEMHFDCVITTSPAESVHYVGWALRKEYGCRWIAELRDHWLNPPLTPIRAAPLRRKLEEPLAKKWLGNADAIVTLTTYIKAEVETLVSRPTVTIPHFLGSDYLHPYPFSEKYIILLHTGAFSISDPARKVDTLLDFFIERISRQSTLRLHLAGPLTDEEQLKIEKSRCREAIVLHGKVDQHLSRRMQIAADYLALVVSDGSQAVPGKFAEYRTTGRPILAFGSGPWRKLVNLDPIPLELNPGKIQRQNMVLTDRYNYEAARLYGELVNCENRLT